MPFEKIIENSVYLLAVINPMSKICILSVLSTQEEREELRKVILESSVAAMIMLFCVMAGGAFVLNNMLHIQLYSLRVSGGVVLFWIGFKALSQGVFFEAGTKKEFAALSLVPLASPMIAGPATIAATLSLSQEAGPLVAYSATAIAVVVNMLFMFSAKFIGAALTKFNIMGAVIRLTGLLVVALGAQMIFSGLQDWLTQVFLK